MKILYEVYFTASLLLGYVWDDNSIFDRFIPFIHSHYCDVMMGTIASQVTSPAIVYLIFHSGADQRKHQSSASLAFVLGIRRGPMNSPHKWPVTWKMVQLDDVIMQFSWLQWCRCDARWWHKSSIDVLCRMELRSKYDSLLFIHMVSYHQKRHRISLTSACIFSRPHLYWQLSNVS